MMMMNSCHICFFSLGEVLSKKLALFFGRKKHEEQLEVVDKGKKRVVSVFFFLAFWVYW